MNVLEEMKVIEWFDFEPYGVEFMPLLNDFNQKKVGYSHFL
jgi:hypothetical protein